MICIISSDGWAICVCTSVLLTMLTCTFEAMLETGVPGKPKQPSNTGVQMALTSKPQTVRPRRPTISLLVFLLPITDQLVEFLTVEVGVRDASLVLCIPEGIMSLQWALKCPFHHPETPKCITCSIFETSWERLELRFSACSIYLSHHSPSPAPRLCQIVPTAILHNHRFESDLTICQEAHRIASNIDENRSVVRCRSCYMFLQSIGVEVLFQQSFRCV